MGTKAKPVVQPIKVLTMEQIAHINEHMSLVPTQVQWFSTVHQELFCLNVRSYEQAAKLVSTLDFNRTCHIRLVNNLHQTIHSFY